MNNINIKILNLHYDNPNTIHNEDKYYYVGRGKDSIFHNIFSHLKSNLIDEKNMCSSRDEAIKKYEIYFRNKLKSDINFRNKFIEMYQSTQKYNIVYLGCWCNPHPCHASIIKKYMIEFHKKIMNIK